MDTVDPSRRHHWSLTLLGIGLIIAFAYFGESVLAVLFFSILLSFVLEPLVELFAIHLRLPRALGSMIAVIILLAMLYGISYASYSRAIAFVETFPNTPKRFVRFSSPSGNKRRSFKSRRKPWESRSLPM
jgi:predicted PurR-regulated permease PerM